MYSHLCTIAFTVTSEHDADALYVALAGGDQHMIAQVMVALYRRIADVIEHGEVDQAIEIYDSIEDQIIHQPVAETSDES